MSILDIVKPWKWKTKLQHYRRVIGISKKPDKAEFITSAKVSGLGILIVGGVGFVIFLIYQLLSGAFFV